ncbi:MAG: glycosyltransferase family 4 protein [Candidatus Methanoperedens sp.]|nr:glycosyltransferase family 4 protein [Candidatus Methanoperedens sp.]
MALKILQTPARFYPYTGGVENYTYYLSRELVRSGHKVKIICAREPKDGKSINNGIKLERLDYIGKIANTNITPTLPFHILKEDFDIIHTHLPTPWSADWSAIFSIGKRKPLVLSYHNDIVGDGAANYIAKGYNRTALKFVLKIARKIIISHSNYLDFSPHLKEYHEKIEIIPYGVDVGRFAFRKTEAENTIFFLSLLDEYHKYKGLDYLLESMRLVKKEIPRVKLKIGGGGKLVQYYKEKAGILGLEDNVEFLGYIPNEIIPEYYTNCNLFVLPSISASQEGFGIVSLEALASGRPVIGTDIVGIAEDIKKHDTGLVVKSGNTKALADAIIRILSDKKEAERMGANGRELIEKKYSWTKIVRKMEDLYNSLEV